MLTLSRGAVTFHPYRGVELWLRKKSPSLILKKCSFLCRIRFLKHFSFTKKYISALSELFFLKHPSSLTLRSINFEVTILDVHHQLIVELWPNAETSGDSFSNRGWFNYVLQVDSQVDCCSNRPSRNHRRLFRFFLIFHNFVIIVMTIKHIIHFA